MPGGIFAMLLPGTSNLLAKAGYHPVKMELSDGDNAGVICRKTCANYRSDVAIAARGLITYMTGKAKPGFSAIPALLTSCESNFAATKSDR